MEEDNLISIIDEGPTRHLFFHGTLDKSAAFNLAASLYSIRADLLVKNRQPAFKGFTAEEETETGTIPINENEFNIILHLNCPGGIVNSAFMVADTIQTLGINVDCIAEGTVASAGVLVFLACNERVMLPHAQIYLHETLHCADNINFNEFKRFNADSKEINKKLKEFYLERTNLTLPKLNKLFKDEVVLDFKQAKEYGFTTA